MKIGTAIFFMVLGVWLNHQYPEEAALVYQYFDLAIQFILTELENLKSK